MAPSKKGKERQATVEEDSPPASTSGQASGEGSGETGGEPSQDVAVSGPQSTSLIPGFSNEQVNSLMGLLSGMLDLRLNQRFGPHRQQSIPIPSIEYSGQAVPPEEEEVERQQE